MDSYITFINDMIEIIPEIDTTNCIISIYLGGSVSRGDYVVGASDIDIYIVVNDESKLADINYSIQKLAREKLSVLLDWCPDGVTVAFTTYNEIKNGTSWLGGNSEYFSFQETGRLLYGKDIRQEIKKPTDSEILLSSHKAIEQLKQIINQDVSNIDKDRYFIRGVFGTIFSAMYFFLCCNKIHVRGKEKIIFEYSNMNKANSENAKTILILWGIFCQRTLTEMEINKLIFITKKIIDEI